MMQNRSNLSDDRSYQVDIFVSLFAILLIVATALAGGLKADSTSVPVQDYRSSDPASDPFSLQGWRLIFAFNEIWVVRDGHLNRLDLLALAEAMAEGKPLFTGEAADDFSAPLTGGRDPGQVKLDLRLRSEVPRELIAEDLALGTAEVAERFTDRRYDNGAQAPYFFVWTDQLAAVVGLFDTLRKRGVPFRWYPVVPSKGQVIARRDVSVYSLEAILR